MLLHRAKNWAAAEWLALGCQTHLAAAWASEMLKLSCCYVQAKLWYVKTAAYDLFVDHVGLSQPAGVPTDNRVTLSVAVEAVEHITNTMAEMRQSAGKALSAVYSYSPESVVKAVCALNSANAKRDATVQVGIPSARH